MDFNHKARESRKLGAMHSNRIRSPALRHSYVFRACNDIRHARIERCNLERDQRSCKCTENDFNSLADLIPLMMEY